MILELTPYVIWWQFKCCSFLQFLAGSSQKFSFRQAEILANCALLGCYAVSCGNLLHNFRYNL